MSDLGGLLTLLALFSKGEGAAPFSATPSGAPMPGPLPSTGPTPDLSTAPAVIPTEPPVAATLPTLPWPSGPVPATLPPFPGPGWEPDVPVTNEIASRATYWNALLWDFGSRTMRKPFVQENFGGQWVTWAAAWHPGDKGPQTFMATEAWRVKTSAAPSPMPMAAPPMAAPPMAAPPMAAPGFTPPMGPPVVAPLLPYPGPGAYHTNGAYIYKLQVALATLGYAPEALDGLDGPHTQAAVRAFQHDHGLTQDGMAGPQTAAAIDAAVAAMHAAPAPMTAAPPLFVPVSTMPAASPAAAPASLLPYPGPGAYHTNAAYIRKLQTALTTLGFSPGPVDGKDGPNTQKAVKAFQTSHGLKPDGLAGPATATEIDKAMRNRTVVGWNLFHAISHIASQAVHTFQHIAHDLGPVGIALAASVGLPPEVMASHGGLAALLMSAHAGHPDAKSKAHALSSQSPAWHHLILGLEEHLKAHPAFPAFHAHVQSAHAAAQHAHAHT
jgi:peptidoglycan hydrolase-like protein with peptidoglycan-binding domain